MRTLIAKLICVCCSLFASVWALSQSIDSLIVGQPLSPYDWNRIIETQVIHYQRNIQPQRLNLTEEQYAELAGVLSKTLLINDLCWGKGETPETSRLQRQRFLLLQDSELSQRLRQIIGPENELAIIARTNFARLGGSASASDRAPMEAMFTHRDVERLLGLDESQKRQINTIREHFIKEAASGNHGILKRFYELADRYFQLMIAELTATQRSRFLEWHGEPIP